MSITFGILHPGAMGSSIAACAKNSGCQVFWASEGRSEQTHARARAQGFQDMGTLAAICQHCQVIASICPPHAAEDVAHQVAAAGFQGLYLDANAIAPERAQREAIMLEAAGASFVDGGILGGPAWQPGTRLYLSGARAQELASCFGAGPVEAIVIGDQPGKASALKMCFAAWTKGSTALLCALVAAAQELGVWEDLQRQWDLGGTDFSAQTAQRLRGVTAKAWRFAGEMEEISATLASAGVPGGFHAAAADLYRRLAPFKDTSELPTLNEVLQAARKEN